MLEPVPNRAARRLLLVSYHFPPVGGAGVQRHLKFAKYLRKFGWDVSVLAASNPSAPVFDQSLIRDIPHDLLIERARTFEPSYEVKQRICAQGERAAEKEDMTASVRRSCMRLFRSAAGVVLLPDQQVLWIPAAMRAALRLLGRVRHDAILATAPAYSNAIVGTLLKQRSGLPLVVDFRDEWDIYTAYHENSQRNPFSIIIQEWMQRQVLRQSDAIVATTKASAASLQMRAEQAGSRAPVTCIYNGYDEADFAVERQATKIRLPPKQGFRIVYTGTLWNLTNVEPLVEAVEALDVHEPEALADIELVFVGRRTREQHAIVERIKRTSCRLHVEDYCNHDEALAWMASADALCLLLRDALDAARVIPAKLFEYLRTRKEILAIIPEGETLEILREHGLYAQFRPSDIAGIANWLRRRALGEERALRGPTNDSAIQQFCREPQSRQLADILDHLMMTSAPARVPAFPLKEPRAARPATSPADTILG